MAGGYAHVPRRALTAAGAAVLVCSVGALSACSSSPGPKTAQVRASASAPTAQPTTTTDPAAAKAAAEALKAATAKAGAEQDAAVKAAAKKYVADQKSGEAAAAKAHPMAAAAAACHVPVAYVQASPSGSRIGMPDVPKRGDIWHVKKTSPISPGMIIYWPDGGKVLCR